MIDLGQMDTYGVLYTRTQLVQPSGSVTYTDARVGDCYLSRQSMPVIASFVAMKDSEQTDAIWKTRWFDGLLDGMILVVEGSTYRITRREELGRREGWRIYARCIQ